MSIATEITRLQTAKADLKTALEAKGATISSEATLDDYPDIVDDIPVALLQDKEVSVSGGTTVIEPDTGYTGMHSVTVTASGGGSPVKEKTVNFIDFDGTIVASYTSVEAQALTGLPSAPDHSEDEVPLTFEEWNWTLADIKSYNTSYPQAIIWVGANYHTTDGKIHIIFKITTDYGSLAFFRANAGGTIDWGDDSAIETYAGGNNKLQHQYTKAGLFDCIVDTEATSISLGGSTPHTDDAVSEVYLPSTITSLPSSAFQYCLQLQRICIPNSVVTVSDQIFSNCWQLRSVTFPKNVVSTGGLTVYNCSNLRSVSFPNGMTSVARYQCSSCSLQNMTIPASVETIGEYAFDSSYCLQFLIVPSGVTSIASNAFRGTYRLETIFMYPTTPPTLENLYALSTYQKHIYVPAGSVEAYKTATNWSSYASKIEAMPS